MYVCLTDSGFGLMQISRSVAITMLVSDVMVHEAVYEVELPTVCQYDG